jgi:hypothetical protein
MRPYDREPVPMEVRSERERVLRCASGIAKDKASSGEVMVHATAIDAWLCEATSHDDRRDRLAALMRAFDNWASQIPAPKPPGEPDGLLATARHYYEYLAA